MPSEADARIKIDRLLREAGWNIEDNTQVSTEESPTNAIGQFTTRTVQRWHISTPSTLD